MDELELFEDIDEALGALVKALGGHKVVGRHFKPEMTIEAAGNWCRDCCNPDRREKFSPSQVIALLKMAREAGYHATMRWIALECSYSAPKPLDPQDQADELRREVIGSVRKLERLTERLERLGMGA